MFQPLATRWKQNHRDDPATEQVMVTASIPDQWSAQNEADLVGATSVILHTFANKLSNQETLFLDNGDEIVGVAVAGTESIDDHDEQWHAGHPGSSFPSPNLFSKQEEPGSPPAGKGGTPGLHKPMNTPDIPQWRRLSSYDASEQRAVQFESDDELGRALELIYSSDDLKGVPFCPVDYTTAIFPSEATSLLRAHGIKFTEDTLLTEEELPTIELRRRQQEQRERRLSSDG